MAKPKAPKLVRNAPKGAKVLGKGLAKGKGAKGARGGGGGDPGQ